MVALRCFDGYSKRNIIFIVVLYVFLQLLFTALFRHLYLNVLNLPKSIRECDEFHMRFDRKIIKTHFAVSHCRSSPPSIVAAVKKIRKC